MRASSRELGAAAAYEAFLIWDRAAYTGRGWGQGVRGPEGLIGLATGEGEFWFRESLVVRPDSFQSEAWNLAADVGADRDPRREERIVRTAAASARLLYETVRPAAMMASVYSSRSTSHYRCQQWNYAEEDWADPRLIEPYHGSLGSRTLDLALPRRGRGSFSSDHSPGLRLTTRRRSFDDGLSGESASSRVAFDNGRR